MIGPILASGARAQTAAPDLHSPWGDDADVLAPAGAASALESAQTANIPAGPQNASPPPSPEDELRAVEAAQQNALTGAPKEYDLAPAPSSPATPSPVTGRPGVMPSRTPLPPRSVQAPPRQGVSAGSRAPLPVYLHIRERGESE